MGDNSVFPSSSASGMPPKPAAPENMPRQAPFLSNPTRENLLAFKRVIAHGNTGISKLPREILDETSKHLDEASCIALAVTNKYLYQQTFPEEVVKRVPVNGEYVDKPLASRYEDNKYDGGHRANSSNSSGAKSGVTKARKVVCKRAMLVWQPRREFLLRIERDDPTVYFCHGCYKLHHWSKKQFPPLGRVSRSSYKDFCSQGDPTPTTTAPAGASQEPLALSGCDRDLHGMYIPDHMLLPVSPIDVLSRWDLPACAEFSHSTCAPAQQAMERGEYLPINYQVAHLVKRRYTAVREGRAWRHAMQGGFYETVLDHRLRFPSRFSKAVIMDTVVRHRIDRVYHNIVQRSTCTLRLPQADAGHMPCFFDRNLYAGHDFHHPIDELLKDVEDEHYAWGPHSSTVTVRDSCLQCQVDYVLRFWWEPADGRPAAGAFPSRYCIMSPFSAERLRRLSPLDLHEDAPSPVAANLVVTLTTYRILGSGDSYGQWFAKNKVRWEGSGLTHRRRTVSLPRCEPSAISAWYSAGCERMPLELLEEFHEASDDDEDDDD